MHVESILKKSFENYKKKHVEIFSMFWKMLKCMLNISAFSDNCKKACWKFQHVLKTVTHIENVCLKFQRMLKTNACSKLCWIFQGVLKTSWKFQGMLKTLICVEIFVETACWKTVRHNESYVEVSRCVENVYVRHVENHIEKCVEVQKNTITFYGTCWNCVADFIFQVQFYTLMRHIYYLYLKSSLKSLGL